MSRRTGARAGRRSERGVVAGGEALLFGVLILLGGTLLMVDVWGLIDTRAALDAAAREYLRSYTEQPDRDAAAHAGERAARDVLHARGRSSADLQIEPPDPAAFGPCGLAEVRVSVRTPDTALPFLDDLAGSTVTVRHRELIDANTEVTPDDAFDPTATLCATLRR